MPLARWVCPKCQDGKLAPARARRDDTRTYCLACSAKAPRLVRRVCPRLEKKRAVKKVKAREAKKRAYKFIAPRGYYVHAGVDMLVCFANCQGKTKSLRTRVTKTGGPATIKGKTCQVYGNPVSVDMVTLRKGPWADAHDARAQAVLAALRTQSSSKDWIRRSCEHYLKVRPRLDSMKKAEEEVAHLLRAKVALTKLGDE